MFRPCQEPTDRLSTAVSSSPMALSVCSEIARTSLESGPVRVPDRII